MRGFRTSRRPSRPRPPAPCPRCGAERIRKFAGIAPCAACTADPAHWREAAEEALGILVRAVPAAIRITILLRDSRDPSGAGDVSFATDEDNGSAREALERLHNKPAAVAEGQVP